MGLHDEARPILGLSLGKDRYEMEPIVVASPRFKVKIASAFYLLNFLTGAFAAVLVGRGLVLYGDVANLIATACYLVVTLLFYDIFKPVNRRLSLLAAFFSLLGCTITVLNLFHLTPAYISPLIFFGFYCLLIGHLISQVDLSASNPWCADGDRRFGLADLSAAAARKASVSLQSGPRHPWGRSADPVAPGNGR